MRRPDLSLINSSSVVKGSLVEGSGGGELVDEPSEDVEREEESDKAGGETGIGNCAFCTSCCWRRVRDLASASARADK